MSNEGLALGPSRKQVSINNPSPEVRAKGFEHLTFSGTSTGISSGTARYTCPDGKTARFVFYNVYLGAPAAGLGANCIVEVGGYRIAIFNVSAGQNNVYHTVVYPYDTAPPLFPGDTILFDNFSVGQTVSWSFRVIEEEI